MQLIGVVGASARALVHSLARSGFRTWAIDLFADRDLKRVAACAICQSRDYPAALPALAAQFPPGPFLYTGGLENHPHIVAEIARTRELWGNPPEVLERVRNPYTLAACGFAAPKVATQPGAGRWLRKPLRSGGGLGIRFAHAGDSPSPHHYYQEFIDGIPMSAIYVDSELIGVTEQLIGEPWLHAAPFAYSGNITVARLSKSRHILTRLGESSYIRGVWGIDFILKDDLPYPVEVNPRYTAGAEVLEHALGVGAFALASGAASARRLNAVGKAIYYAPHAFAFPPNGPWDADLTGEFDPWRLPQYADIPEAGALFEVGWPVLTFFAKASSPIEVRARLQSHAAELDHFFKEYSS